MVLIVPFTKLKEEARRNPASVDIDSVDPKTIQVQIKERGQLAIASYETVAKHRPKLQSIVTKGVRLITVFDEIQVWHGRSSAVQNKPKPKHRSSLTVNRRRTDFGTFGTSGHSVRACSLRLC